MSNLEINNRIGTAIIAMALAGTMTIAGINIYNKYNNKKIQKAIIFTDDTALIVEIKDYSVKDKENLYVITTKEGLTITTPFNVTRLIDDKDSSITAEDVAKSIKGQDVTIIYLNEDIKVKTK